MSFDRDRYKVDVLRAYLSDDGVPPPAELYQWPPDDGETAAAHIESVREYWHLQATKAGPVAMLCKRFLEWDRENGSDAVAALTAAESTSAGSTSGAPSTTAGPTPPAEDNSAAVAEVAERCRRHDPVSAATGLINIAAFAAVVAAEGITASDDDLVRSAAQVGLRVQRPVERSTVETALGLASRLPELNSQVRQAGVLTAAHLLRDDPSAAIGFANRQSISIGGREIGEDDIHAAISRLDRKAVNAANRAARTALRSLTTVVGTPALLDLVTLQAISATVTDAQAPKPQIPGPQPTLALIDDLVSGGFDRPTAAVIAVKSPVAAYRAAVVPQAAPTPTPAPTPPPRPAEAPPMVPRTAPTAPNFAKAPSFTKTSRPPVQQSPTGSMPHFPPIVPQSQPQHPTWRPQPTPQQYRAGTPYGSVTGRSPQSAPVWLWIATFVPILSCFGIVTAIVGGIALASFTSGKPSRGLLKVTAVLEFVLGGLLLLAGFGMLLDSDMTAMLMFALAGTLAAAGFGHLNLSSRVTI
ncbi:hypothetical protein [Gordonia sp. (in: high G+C Gram-positive bacteria)]|uniref:hypothetical protein n=1 Tax=Gordonia sp. (in: high G+C Gram-positive bacteria) TaxID=84139 RepID=UPI0016BABAE4|nr:hypothetical protein [Gordonia sp. (in: high G+C Gram-positive bacteria)]NLG47176.1 hypothetical protein [Gordonia sp. (in: high G+C Gram-positive bacteria)]